jgi:hypothetical protein
VEGESGIHPSDCMVLRRQECIDQKLDGSHSVISSHFSCLYAPEAVKNQISETHESFKLYTVALSGTGAWLGGIFFLQLC